MLLHLHHVLDPCGFTVLYLHQSSGSGRHFGKCIGVDGWFVCVSVSLPFLLVCVFVCCGDFPFMSWTRSTNEQLHQAQKEPQTAAAAAAPSPSPTATAATSASAVLVSSKDQRPGTGANSLNHLSIQTHNVQFVVVTF